MSGGHWNYSHHQIQDMLEEIATDAAVVQRFPRLAAQLVALARGLHSIISDLDSDLSGDSGIEHDAFFEEEAFTHLDRDELTDALHAVLMFHSEFNWNDDKRAEWKHITGREDATTRTLCDHVRKVLGVER